MNVAPSTAGTVSALARAAREGGASQPTVDEPGIGPWTVTRLLAAGRWTRVYRVRPAQQAGASRGRVAPRALYRLAEHDDHIDRQALGDFVLKTVLPECAADPFPRALLRRESVVGSLVQHPHLSTVLADHSADERPYLLLPYLEGATLAQVLAASVLGASDRVVLLPVATACLIARQTVMAIAALHEAGWLHGDVAPTNVLVAASGHTTLLDLGLARRIGSEECRSAKLLIATPGYAAPELFSLHGQLTPAGDVYSLGVLLFELLAGRPLFAAARPADLIRLHRHEAPPDVRLHRPTASPELAELVRRMLAKEPLRRPAAGEVARWLAEIEIASFGA